MQNSSNSAREIENLLYAYGEYIDSGNFARVAGLFAHARIMPDEGASPEASVVGENAVLAMYQASTRLHADGTPRPKHIITNAIIEVDPNDREASARSYFTVLQQTDVLALQPIISGRSHDTIARIEDRWVFATRIMRVDLVGDLKEHLLYELAQNRLDGSRVNPPSEAGFGTVEPRAHRRSRPLVSRERESESLVLLDGA